MKIDLTKVSNVWVSNIDYKDFPNFVDALIESAEYDGREMTEEELDFINDDREFVYEKLMEQLY